MILQFEIYIVKVPLMNLYGIQQKKMSGKLASTPFKHILIKLITFIGNTWSYKNMITKIISELRL